MPRTFFSCSTRLFFCSHLLLLWPFRIILPSVGFAFPPRRHTLLKNRITFRRELQGFDLQPHRYSDKDDFDMDEYCDVVDDFGCQAVEWLVTDEHNAKEVFRWIRLEHGADPTLAKVNTQQAVLDKIESVKQLQRKCAPCDLYERHWQRFDQSELPVNGATQTAQHSNETFTIAQFNVLAEGLSSAPDTKKPFQASASDADSSRDKTPGFGGFTHVPFKETVLDFALRRWRLLEVLLSTYNNERFDIIALEEVDRYHGFFSPMLRLFGYNSFFAPKSRSPCLQLGWYSDGCALFWKTDKFELVSARRHEFRVGSQVYILAVFRHIATQQLMVVAVTHLKAQSSASNEKVRCAQVEELLTNIANCARNLKVAFDDVQTRDVAVLFAGDLNADIQCEFEESCIQQGVLGSNALNESIKSAYPVDPSDATSFYTTWKIRGTKESKRVIDYIFYGGKKISCTAILRVPPDLEATRLPCLRYPSDHMLIAAEFSINAN